MDTPLGEKRARVQTFELEVSLLNLLKSFLCSGWDGLQTPFFEWNAAEEAIAKHCHLLLPSFLRALPLCPRLRGAVDDALRQRWFHTRGRGL